MEEEIFSSMPTVDLVVIKPEDSEHCLFLGDLSAFSTEEILQKEFVSFGKILHLQIARSKSNHKSLFYGFLTFEESSSAVNALNAMNHKIICGRAIKLVMFCILCIVNTNKLIFCRLRWANLTPDGNPVRKHEELQQEKKTFSLKVTNIDITCSGGEQAFTSLFAHYEHLVSIDWKHLPSSSSEQQHHSKNSSNHNKPPYALIQYWSASSAAMAMRELDGKLFGNSSLQIQWATSNSTAAASLHKKNDEEEKQIKLAAKLAKQEVSIYLTFVGMNPEVLVTEETLRKVFGVFGPIDDVAIRLSLTDNLTSVQKGYAFVYFITGHVGIEAAIQARKGFQVDKEVDNVFYHVELSKRLKMRLGIKSHEDNEGGHNEERDDVEGNVAKKEKNIPKKRFPNQQQYQQQFIRSSFVPSAASAAAIMPPPPLPLPRSPSATTAAATMMYFPLTTASANSANSANANANAAATYLMPHQHQYYQQPHPAMTFLLPATNVNPNTIATANANAFYPIASQQHHHLNHHHLAAQTYHHQQQQYQYHHQQQQQQHHIMPSFVFAPPPFHPQYPHHHQYHNNNSNNNNYYYPPPPSHHPPSSSHHQQQYHHHHQQ